MGKDNDENESGEQLSAGWETVKSTTGSKYHFNFAKGVGNLELDGMTIDDIHVDMGNGTAYTPNASGKAAVAELFLNAIRVFINATDSEDYKYEEQVKNPGAENEERRTVVWIGSTSDRRRKAQYEPGVEYSFADMNLVSSQSGSKFGMDTARIMAENMYRQITGEEPDPSKTYDLKVVFSDSYLKNPYIGTVVKDEQGKAKLLPDTDGVKILLTESARFEKPKQMDITEFFEKTDRVRRD